MQYRIGLCHAGILGNFLSLLCLDLQVQQLQVRQQLTQQELLAQAQQLQQELQQAQQLQQLAQQKHVTQQLTQQDLLQQAQQLQQQLQQAQQLQQLAQQQKQLTHYQVRDYIPKSMLEYPCLSFKLSNVNNQAAVGIHKKLLQSKFCEYYLDEFVI